MNNIKLMALDMEYNQPTKSIIQVGVAVGNLRTGEVLDKGYWNIYVDEEVTPFITDLTGITQKDVNSGVSLQEAYKSICSMHTAYACFRNSLTWGGGDTQDLRHALCLDDEMFVFGRRWIDAKTVYVSWCFANGFSHQAGLAKAMTKLDLQFIGKKHTAMDDAVNTFRIYHKLLEQIN